MPGRRRYEYMTRKVKTESVDDVINEHAREGWRVISKQALVNRSQGRPESEIRAVVVVFEREAFGE